MKNKECFYSSLFFLINALVAYKYKYYGYSLSFIFLTITSLFHHYHFNNITRQIDRVAIIIMIYLSTLIIYTKYKDKNINLMHILLFGILFSIVLFLYIYGKINNQYCFDTDHTTACLWHSFLHLMASSSHILIVLL